MTTPCNLLCSSLLSLTITAYIVVIAVDSTSPSSSCHPDQRDALLQLKNSFFVTEPPPIDSYDTCRGTSYPKTDTWREDKDCCSWEGVECDNSTGDIVGLDLSCARLHGAIDSNSYLFSLCHLRSLSLAKNDLIGSSIPPEISLYSQMAYLNLSSSNISGNVPTEISQLSKLVSLDLSDNVWLEMQNPTMRMLVTNLTQLEELDLSYVDMSRVIPTSMMNFSSSLISLHLSVCSLGGRFPDYIFQLPNLQRLDLSENFDLHGALPESNWSSSLAFLSLRYFSFNGEVPHSIGSLPRLTYLDLSWNHFTAHVDFRSFSTLKNLRFLGLSRLSVSGEDATDAKHLFPKPEMLIISNGTLENFPCFFSSMPELRNMSLSMSNVSEFPGQCINNGLSFPLLQRLEMESCNLTKFPSLSQSKKLRFLNLRGNRMEEIPSWFWGIGIDTLEELDLRDNLLKGELRLPWKRLAHLYVQNNSFEGQLPIPRTPCIREFITSQNRFNGSISPSICQLTHLQDLELDQNNLTGILPPCLSNLTDLWYLNLSSNSLTGPLPRSLVNCTSIEYLDVSYNSFSDASPVLTGSLKLLHLQDNNFIGQWPGDVFLRSTSIQSIDLSNNKFEGLLPLPSYATYHYSVSNNNFSGEISSSLCNATNLQLLDMSNNRLTGTLPQCLKDVTIRLNFLNVRANGFHGSIPEIFHEQSMLTSLDFSRNKFAGRLPRSLSNCQSLEVLEVGSNKIVDSFPNWLGDLPLKVLNLRSNKFHGRVSISKGTRPFSSIRILDISINGFDGSLPDNLITETFGLTQMDNGTQRYMGGDSSPYSVMINLKGVEIEMVKINVQFATLDLSSNHFCGEIPRNIGLLKALKGLNFSHNSFTRTIPPSIVNLTNLESLDLSSNNLVGGIPRELVKLTSLGALNLSFNNLTGPIPSGGQFDTFSNASFEGNPGLYGIPLTRSCDHGCTDSLPPANDGEDEPGGWLDWKFVVIGFGSGVGIGISLGYMALEMGRPLWLARLVIQLEGSCRKRSKKKATKRNGRR